MRSPYRESARELEALPPIWPSFLFCALLGLAALVGAVSCGSGLSSADLTAIRSADRLALDRYRDQDAASSGAALDRGIYCALEGVLVRNAGADASVPDSGVACAP